MKLDWLFDKLRSYYWLRVAASIVQANQRVFQGSRRAIATHNEIS